MVLHNRCEALSAGAFKNQPLLHPNRSEGVADTEVLFHERLDKGANLFEVA